MISSEQWDISHLRQHLQFAVDLEFWTIPFYMSAMYSVEDRSSRAYQLIRTVLNQEMLHLQCAANLANAYGFSPTFKAPKYEGQTIPHLDFSGDNQRVVEAFEPYTAEIGPLDLEHINGMCLVEIPEDLTGEAPELNEDVTEYGSIGQFYQAVAYGAEQLQDKLRGGVRQVDFFSAYYRNMPDMKITEDGARGFAQASLLIDLITDQGEGAGKKVHGVKPVFENTADDIEPTWSHFDKFKAIKAELDGGTWVHKAKPLADYTARDHELQAILVEEFTRLRHALEQLFKGEDPKDFFPIMASVGGAIRNCWVNGVTPKFS